MFSKFGFLLLLFGLINSSYQQNWKNDKIVWDPNFFNQGQVQKQPQQQVVQQQQQFFQKPQQQVPQQQFQQEVPQQQFQQQVPQQQFQQQVPQQQFQQQVPQQQFQQQAPQQQQQQQWKPTFSESNFFQKAPGAQAQQQAPAQPPRPVFNQPQAPSQPVPAPAQPPAQIQASAPASIPRPPQPVVGSVPNGPFPIQQPTITNTGEKIVENLIGGIVFDCVGKSTGHHRDSKYCDVFHACVFGQQRKTYSCPFVGEHTYFDDVTRRCEFARNNPVACASNAYLSF